MSKKHTKGRWVNGKVAGSIVAKEPNREAAMDTQSDAYRYYGGHLICESVAPKNMAIIKAAPKMLKALKAAQSVGGDCGGFCAYCERSTLSGCAPDCVIGNAIKAAEEETA